MAFQKSMSFLKKLKNNNNKDWFDKNKIQFLETKEEFEDFIQKLIGELAKIDKRINPELSAKSCVFRIYKDVRFSKDKTPYKTNFGASINPGGKKSMEAGYYFHLEPGNVFIAGGNYMPMPEQLQAIRQEIDYNGDKLQKIINAKEFKSFFKGLDDDDKLKTVPKGFYKEHKHLELLKLKSFIAFHKIDDKKLTSSSFLKDTIKGYKAMLPLNQFLREALDN